MAEMTPDRVLRDHLGHPVPCGQEECSYGVQECTFCPDSPDRRRVDPSWSSAVDAALKQAGRSAMLACRLVEEGVFETTDEAIAWADAQEEEVRGL